MGVYIGRKVIVVVFRWAAIRRFAMLSVWAAVIVVLVCWVLLCWREVRQLSIIGRMIPSAMRDVMFVFFIVVLIYCKGNTSGESVQFIRTGSKIDFGGY